MQRLINDYVITTAHIEDYLDLGCLETKPLFKFTSIKFAADGTHMEDAYKALDDVVSYLLTTPPFIAQDKEVKSLLEIADSFYVKCVNGFYDLDEEELDSLCDFDIMGFDTTKFFHGKPCEDCQGICRTETQPQRRICTPVTKFHKFLHKDI